MQRFLCVLCCLCLLGLTSCAAEAVEPSTLVKPKDTNESWDDSAVAVTLNGSAVDCADAGVSWDAAARVLTIAKKGDYLLAGTLEGRIEVAVSKDEDVRLILNGVTVNSPEGPALYVASADKVILTLAADSAFSDATSLTVDEDTISSCVYSKDDLSINGAATLSIVGNVKNGLVCKNDLLMVNGTLSVTASGNGVRGKDSFTLLGGAINVVSEGDGIVSDNDDEAADILIAGGTVNVTAGGGAGNAAAHEQNWGRFAPSASDDGVSMKAIKASGAITVQGGTLTLDSADDALHAASITVLDGELALASGDDGMHADGALLITGGKVTIRESYEGLEGETVTVTGGDIAIVSSDDGVNAAGGSDSEETGWGFGGFDSFGADASASIVISGGVLRVNAEGDGLDSNGDLTVSGGEIYVSGPSNGGNGALDYGGACSVSGGVIVAADSGGMSQNIGENSTQAGLMVSGNGGGEIVLKDASGNVLLSYTPDKSYGCVVLSCPALTVGESYVVTFGGNEVYSGTLTQTITGGTGGFGGWGGGGGFGGGGHGGRR